MISEKTVDFDMRFIPIDISRPRKRIEEEEFEEAFDGVLSTRVGDQPTRGSS